MKSDAELRNQMCTGKQRYKTKRYANEKVKLLKASGTVTGKLKAYRCPFCVESWHIGHQPPADVLTSLRQRLRTLSGALESK